MLQKSHQRSQRQYQTATFQQKQKNIEQLNQIWQKNTQQTDRKFHNITELATESQKVLIKKSDLQAFTKHFANQKIKYDQQRQSFSKKLIQYQILIQEMSKQNVLLQKQKNQYKQKFVKQHQNVKIYEKRIKQLQNFQIVQLKRNVSELQSKLRYEEEQLTRYQQFLKIKEEIIKNLQWEKSISNQRSKTHRSFNYKTQNVEEYYTERNNMRTILQNEREKHSETLRLQDLSQIAQNTDQKFYGLTNNQTSKSKKNHIRIGVSHEKQLVKGLHQQKSKKVITIKKRMNTESQMLHNKKIDKQQPEQIKDNEKEAQNLQETIAKLRQQAYIIQKDNDKLLNERKKITDQINSSQNNNNPKILNLQKTLDEKNQLIQKLQNQLASKGFNSSLNKKLKNQTSLKSQNSNFNNSSRKALQASNKFAADKDRSILILHQKCITLEKQIQKFMKKIMNLEKKNKQMESQIKKNTRKTLGSQQLITPQFKDIKFKKFFPKPNNLNLSQSQLNKQNSKFYKSYITDTFSKHELSSSLSKLQKKNQSPGINESSQQKRSIIRNFNIDQIDDDEESMALQSDLKLFK